MYTRVKDNSCTRIWSNFTGKAHRKMLSNQMFHLGLYLVNFNNVHLLSPAVFKPWPRLKIFTWYMFQNENGDKLTESNNFYLYFQLSKKFRSFHTGKCSSLTSFKRFDYFICVLKKCRGYLTTKKVMECISRKTSLNYIAAV